MNMKSRWIGKEKTGIFDRLSARTLDQIIPGRVAQSVTCLATDACLTADHKLNPGPVPYFRRD